jgi:RND family efflux transporter MFP subunit
MKVPVLLASIVLAMVPAVVAAQTGPVSRAAAPLDPAGHPVGVQVAARSTAVISAPMAGQLVEFPAADGDAIREGQLLVRFNCSQQEAVLARAHAELAKRQDLLKTQQALKALNVYSRAEYATAQNDVGVAKADVAVAQTSVENCVVKAPFSGRIASTSVRNHQFVQAGAPLLDLVDEHDLELEFIVPSPWLAWLRPGAATRVQISETGQRYIVNITRISGKVDAASQTIKIYGRIEGDAGALLPGMSGTAQFAGAPS